MRHGLGRFGATGKPTDGVLCDPLAAAKNLDATFKGHTFCYPSHWAGASMSWSCIESAAAQKVLYFASHDPIARYKVYHFERHAKDNASDIFAFIEHTPLLPPGKAFDGSPVVLRVVDGNRQAALKVYRAWFERTFGICKPSQSWLRRESFFLFTMFELPEGTNNYRFKDIPQWAKSAKDHGINSVQISGWNVGGHDNGYPDYTPSPRLGTWKELEDGIKACHQMGLRVYFFVNYQPVMIESEWYKKELYRYHEWADPGGQPTWNTGWPMGTLWGRMGHPKRMVFANPAFPQYRKIIVDQFARLAQIGADGVHVDKMMPAPIDFNPDLPMSADTAGLEGAVILTKEIFAACRKHNPDWAMSFECHWDRMMEFTCSYWWGDGRLNQVVFPDSVGTVGITSAFDYLGVNALICQKRTILVGPMNFCRSLDWEPWAGLARYIKEVKGIQDRLTDTVWLGDDIGTAEVLLGDGVAGLAPYVFRNRTTGKHVCILSSTTRQLKKQAVRGFQGNTSGQVRVHAPFQETKTLSLPAEIEVPGERIVFVEEL
jgi:hypothetical protein